MAVEMSLTVAVLPSLSVKVNALTPLPSYPVDAKDVHKSDGVDSLQGMLYQCRK